MEFRVFVEKSVTTGGKLLSDVLPCLKNNTDRTIKLWLTATLNFSLNPAA